MSRKIFEERAASAIDDPRARLSDLRRLMAEGEELSQQIEATHDQATADAVDFRLAQPDREAAELLSGQTARRSEAIEGALQALRQKLAQCQASEKQQAAEADRAAAIAERDDLSAQLATVLQPITETLPELLAAVRENKIRMKRAGLKLPDAELAARGLESDYPGGRPIFRFTEMRIPEWGGAGQVWPAGPIASPGYRAYDPAKAKADRDETIQRQRRKWGRYRVHPPGSGGRVKFTERTPAAVPDRIIGVHPEFEAIEANIDHAEAERLRSLGLKVEKLPDEVRDESLMHW
jgi:exonuclease VII large subunit